MGRQALISAMTIVGAAALLYVVIPLESHPQNLLAACVWAIPIGLTVSLVATGFLEERREKTRKWQGRCLVCGYSLTGNVSRICPECGMPVDRS